MPNQTDQKNNLELTSVDPKPGKYILKTLGCKANFYDTQLIETQLQKKGWVPALNEAEADLSIVNSCTVTNEADVQSKKTAQQLFKKNSQSIVVFTGCGAEVTPDLFKKTPGVQYIVGNQDKHRLVELVLEKLPKGPGAMNTRFEKQEESHNPYPLGELPVGAPGKPGPDEAEVLGSVSPYHKLLSQHPTEREWPAPAASFFTAELQENSWTSRTRSFLKVQEGCNSFCTYCIIPYGRGPARSLEIEAVIDQVWIGQIAQDTTI
jgi:threonylcarbamoyladenosine tRNA methylthiotransferase MtaB